MFLKPKPTLEEIISFIDKTEIIIPNKEYMDDKELLNSLAKRSL